jgi:hypothetical protein
MSAKARHVPKEDCHVKLHYKNVPKANKRIVKFKVKSKAKSNRPWGPIEL